jgi:hypothetical protein
VKKLISIGVALALLTMVVVPAAVAAAGFPDDPGTYSKTPFGILGTGIQLVGTIVTDLATAIDGFGLPVSAAEIAGVLNSVGGWTGEELAWLTDMTGWSMVAVGDVVGVIKPLAATMGFDAYIEPVADVFYMLGARIFDTWGTLLPGAGVSLPAAGYLLPLPTP